MPKSRTLAGSAPKCSEKDTRFGYRGVLEGLIGQDRRPRISNHSSGFTG